MTQAEDRMIGIHGTFRGCTLPLCRPSPAPAMDAEWAYMNFKPTLSTRVPTGPETLCNQDFGYYGVSVHAYAFIRPLAGR